MRFADLDGIADRRLPGDDADDRRERHRPTPRTSTRCSTTRSAHPATTASSRPTCTPTAATMRGSRPSSTPRWRRGVPVVSARQMLTWLDGRNGSSFANLTWNAGTLTFSIARGAGSNGLQAMLPTQGANGSLAGADPRAEPRRLHDPDDQGHRVRGLRRRGRRLRGDVRRRHDGRRRSARSSAVPGAGGTATVTWTTDEPATSRVDYGTSAGSLTLNVADPALVTSHTLQLTGLAPNTTYYFRVTSADGAAEHDDLAESARDAGHLHDADRGRHRHDRRRLQRRHDRRLDLRVRHGRRRGHPRADGRRRVRAGPVCPAAGRPDRWTGGTATVAGGSVTVDGSWIRDRRASSRPAARSSSSRTFSGDAFQNAGFGVDPRRAAGESWAMFGTERRRSGLLQARTTTESGEPSRRRARRAVHRLAAPLSASSGTRAASASTSTASSSTPPRHDRRDDAARSPATTTSAAAHCPSTGCG